MARTSPDVVVVAADASVREAGADALTAAGLAAQAACFDEPFDALEPLCLLVDLDPPRMTGLEVVRRMRQSPPCTPVIVMTDNCNVQTAVGAMKDGAADVVDRDADIKALVKRIRAAIAAAAESRDRSAQAIEVDGCIRKLTPRERQVMDLIIDGRLNRQIAEHLGVTEKTVEVHRSRVMSKTQANSVADLVRMVLTWRIYNDSR